MKAHEKAKALIYRYRKIKMSPSVHRSSERAKQCAIIVCEENIRSLFELWKENGEAHTANKCDWWREVKREIEKL